MAYMISPYKKRNARLLDWTIKVISGFSINFILSVCILNLTGVIGTTTLLICLIPCMTIILLCIGIAVLKDLDP